MDVGGPCLASAYPLLLYERKRSARRIVLVFNVYCARAREAFRGVNNVARSKPGPTTSKMNFGVRV